MFVSSDRGNDVVLGKEVVMSEDFRIVWIGEGILRRCFSTFIFDMLGL